MEDRPRKVRLIIIIIILRAFGGSPYSGTLDNLTKSISYNLARCLLMYDNITSPTNEESKVDDAFVSLADYVQGVDQPLSNTTLEALNDSLQDALDATSW